MTLTPLHSIEAAIAKSHNDFCTYVWPEIAAFFPAGRLVEVEGQPDDCSRQLDVLGIDYLYAPANGEPYGVSQRTGEGNWRTVTMNEPTLRRWTNLWGRSGPLLPSVHVQAYLAAHPGGNKTFLAASVIPVGQFVRYADEHPGVRKINHQRGTAFLSWTFDELDAAGVSIATVPNRQLEAPFGP
jgi:hypothetical protein